MTKPVLSPIYLDNAATSYPKPEKTIERLNDFVVNMGGNPGRSGHKLSLDAARIVFDTREELTRFIGGTDSERLIFTQNGTESLNLAILGFARKGDHIIATSMEHNSVMRPLSFLRETRGVEYSLADCSSDGLLDVEHLKSLVRPNTRAVIINHGSNVCGVVQPVAEVRSAIGELTLIVDACQTIGSLPIHVESEGIDIICFSCHKALYSIQGLGAIYMRRPVDLTPLRFGGTGSKSEFIEQPVVLPDKYESGTPGTPAIASLSGGLEFINSVGLAHIVERKRSLREQIVQGLENIEGVVVYGPKTVYSGPLLPVVSFNIVDKLPSAVGHALNKENIYTRIGLHCSPVAHTTLGTFPAGAVRTAPGYFTTSADIERFLEVVREIAGN